MQNTDLSNKVNTTDSRLSDARTPKTHTHNDLYYTKNEINPNFLNLNRIKLSEVWKSSVSIPSNTETIIASLTLDAGLYIITASSFINGASSTSAKKRYLAVKMNTGSVFALQQTIVPASCNYGVELNGAVAVNFSGTVIFNAVILQDSGSTVTANCLFQAIRIK